MPDINKLKAFFTIPNVGTCETGMVDGWRLLRKQFPDMKIVVVRRPLQEVKNSLKKFGIFADEELERRDKILEELGDEEGVLLAYYSELNNMHMCKKIFEYCLELPFDKIWWKSLRNKNIQIDIIEQMKKIEENRSAINQVKAYVSQQMEMA